MKHLLAATFALSMLAAPAAIAAPYGHQTENRPAATQVHGSGNRGSQTHADARPDNPRQQYRYEGRNYDAVRNADWKAPKGYAAHRDWKRGEKLPPAFRARAYRVDYRALHLKQPPRGYAWVRADRHVYLISERNGVISQVVFNIFYN